MQTSNIRERLDSAVLDETTHGVVTIGVMFRRPYETGPTLHAVDLAALGWDGVPKLYAWLVGQGLLAFELPCHEAVKLDRHPTRTLPLCSTCKHTTPPYKTAYGQRLGGEWCNHPLASVNVIDGRSNYSCSDMRAHGPNQCGPAGTFYERRADLATDCDDQGVQS